MRRLARLRRLLALRALGLALPVTLLRPLARRARLLPIVLLLAVAAVAVTMARLPGALPAALVPLRLVPLRRRIRMGPGFEAGDDPLLDAPADQALDRSKQWPLALHAFLFFTGRIPFRWR